MDFHDKVVLVTGASSGIGRATALTFARCGATVVGVARREDALRELAAQCRSEAGSAHYVAGDLSEREFAVHAVDETVRTLGRIDVLVNNAAVNVHRDLYGISIDEAEAAMRTNFHSCLWTTFTAIPYMLAAGGGHVVNVSSFATQVVPTHETIYAASKAAMNGFTEGLFQDLAGSNIHASLIYPGPIATEIWDKIEDFDGYDGKLYPAGLVADGILDAIVKRRQEVVLPRRNLMLTTARILRRIAPKLVRAGAARRDPVRPAALERARRRALEGRRLGR